VIICRSCWHAWPDESMYCGNCQHSFGGRRCPHGHLSSKSARFCTECASKDLSKPTESLHFGIFAKGLAWLITCLLVKWLVPHLPQVVVFFIHFLDWFTVFIFGFSILGVITALTHIAFIAILYALLLGLFFPKFRQKLPALARFAFRTLQSLWKVLFSLLKLSFHFLRLFAQGIYHENKSKNPRSPYQ